MTQRINNVSNPEGKAAELLDGVKAALGATPNMFTAFANAPSAMEGYLGLNGALQGGVLDAEFKEKIALTVAGINGCTYCASAHTFLSEKAGVDSEEIALNLKGSSKDSKSQSGLDFVAKIVNNRGHVSQDAVDAVRSAGFSDEAVIEIVTHVALNTLTNYFNEVFQIDVDFPVVNVSGMSCAA